jgi:xylobiose transport system permease protein
VRRPNWVAGGLAIVWLVITAVPILTMLSWAFQYRTDFVDHGPIAPPLRPTLSNFTAVIDSGFLTYLKNTVIVTVACVALTLAIAIPAAYAIVRSHSWLAGTAFRVFLLGLAIPAQAVIIPVYLLVVRLQLYDTVWAIVLPTVAFGLPLVVLVLAGSLRDITRDMYEAMTVDGAGAFRMLVNLVIPLSRGSITAV